MSKPSHMVPSEHLINSNNEESINSFEHFKIQSALEIVSDYIVVNEKCESKINGPEMLHQLVLDRNEKNVKSLDTPM